MGFSGLRVDVYLKWGTDYHQVSRHVAWLLVCLLALNPRLRQSRMFGVQRRTFLEGSCFSYVTQQP